jgi:tryptophanyl-tRNA synthetase
LPCQYRSGGLGYGAAKEELIRVVFRELGPIREKYEHYIQRPDDIRDMLNKGKQRARNIAGETIEEVRQSLGLR